MQCAFAAKASVRNIKVIHGDACYDDKVVSIQLQNENERVCCITFEIVTMRCCVMGFWAILPEYADSGIIEWAENIAPHE
jgi:hypothetical protein